MSENKLQKKQIVRSLILFGASIILLTGSIMIPSIVTRNYIQPGIVDTLSFIRENSTDDIKIGTYSLYMEEIPNEIPREFGTIFDFIDYVNASIGMNIFSELWDNLTALPVYGGDFNSSLVGLFNDNIQSDYGSSIKGVSEALNNSDSMGFNITNSFAIINGTSFEKNNNTYYLPGILQLDYTEGLGLMEFLRNYDKPWDAPGNLNLNNLTEIYDLPSRHHLDIVVLWVHNILYASISAYTSEQVGFLVPEVNIYSIKNEYIKLQWAYKLILPQGMNSTNSIYNGFEVSTNFTNMNQLSAVWDSFMNRTLIPEWFSAMEGNIESEDYLKNQLNLTILQYSNLELWLSNLEFYLQNFLTDILELDSGSFYERMFYRQWSEKLLFEDGICDGFEIYDLDIKDYHVMNLWDENNQYSITNLEGVRLWFKAINKRNGRAYVLLADKLLLTEDQMDSIRLWLEEWKINTFYEVAECNGLYRNIKTEVEFSTSILAYTSAVLSLIALGIIIFKKNDKFRTAQLLPKQ